MSTLRIGLVGVLEDTNSSNYKLLKALKNNRHIMVFPFDYRKEMSINFGTFHDRLVDLSKNIDVCIVCKGNGIALNTIRDMKSNCKIFHYFMDPFINLKNHKDLLEISKICDWRSSTGLEISKRWESLIGMPVNHITDGADSSVFYKDSTLNKKYQVSFVGSMTDERSIIFELLKNNGFSPNFIGTEFGHIDENEIRKICNESKIVLNLSIGSSIGYTSSSLWNFLSCGSFVLTKKIPLMQETLGLIPMTHLDEFDSPIELMKMIDYYLCHEDERESIATNGLNFVRNVKSWNDTVNLILNIIEGY